MDMSRIIALFIVVFSFFSCEKEIVDSSPIPAANGITFSIDSVLTRGSVITSENISSMAMFCYTTPGVFDGTTLPNYMYKADVERLSSSAPWVTQPATGDAISNTQWDGASYHSFFAFAPYDIESSGANSYFSSSTTVGPPTFHYMVPASPLAHKDLLYSSHLNAVKYYVSNRPVTLTFAHALSKITFSGMKSNYEAVGTIADKVVVKCFEFSNLWRTATLAFNETPGGSFVGEWDYSASGPKEHDISSTIANGGLINNVLTTNMSNLTTLDEPMMPIPQTFGPEAVMTVVMDVTKSEVVGVDTVRTTNEYIKQFNLVDIVPLGWVIGKSYHYRFTYNGDGILPSSVKVSMVNWNEAIVDGDICGTYLDVASNDYVASDVVKIYYSTDATEAITWSGNSNGTITHTAGSGYLEYTPSSVGVDNITITAGNLSRTVSLTSLGVDPSTVTPNPFTGDTYVGAFWKANETEERLIDMKHNNPTWTAKVLWADDRWSPGDIVLDMNYPTMFPVDNMPPFNLLATTSSVSGTLDIKFRIGLKSIYIPTFEYPARYALVLVESGANKQFLYLRQGENPDYLMRKGDTDKNGTAIVNNRDYARKFSVYNLIAPDIKSGIAQGGTTATNNAQHPRLDTNEDAVFVDYPTQAGSYWQHMVNTSNLGTYGRRSYHPTNPPTSALGSWGNGGAYSFSLYWNTLEAAQKVSPLTTLNGVTYDFRRPNDGTISGSNTSGPISVSEMRQSLWQNPTSGSGSTNNENLTWGYYADGFFDRRTIGVSEGSSAHPNSTVAQGSQDVAYMGGVFFNPITYASIFFPASGFRLYTDGTLTRTGSGGGYWTSSTYNTPNGWCFYPHMNTTSGVYTAGQFAAARSYGFVVRPVVNE